jgi:ATP synthase F1 gamma subunit
MTDERSIALEIEQLKGLHTMTQAYEEIASIRMKRTRSSVLSNREFLDQINKVFDQVRTSYAKKVAALVKGKRGAGARKITFLAHNGKAVSLLLSANTGLYGDIVRNSFDLFMAEVKTGKTEVAIVGRHGLSLFLQEMPDRPYTYFNLPDQGVATEPLSAIVKHIVQYQEIHVFYGKFYNVIIQRPDMFSVSSEISLPKGREIKVSYLFEPSLERILMFFETEIFASLFDQTVRESQLAKFASRVMAMDKAGENIKENLKELKFEKLKNHHRTFNRKQLNSLPSVLMR